MCSEHLRQPTVGQNYLAQSLCCNRMLSVSKFIECWYVEVSVLQNVGFLKWSQGAMACCRCPALKNSIAVLHITSLGKDQNSKLPVGFPAEFQLCSYHGNNHPSQGRDCRYWSWPDLVSNCVTWGVWLPLDPPCHHLWDEVNNLSRGNDAMHKFSSTSTVPCPQ